jgi:hypothetical protein
MKSNRIATLMKGIVLHVDVVLLGNLLITVVQTGCMKQQFSSFSL